MLVFGALSAIHTAEAEANEAKNNEHLDADSSVPEINLGNLIFENPFWTLAGGVLMVSKDNKRQRKPRRAKIKIAPGQNKQAGKNQKYTQKWATEELGIETPKAFMNRVVKLCAHEEQGNFLDVLQKELKEQYDKLDNRINDQAMRLDYLLHAILSYPEVLKENKKHLNHSMLHISFNHDKLFTLLKDLRDELDLGPYKLHLTEEKHIPGLIQMGFVKAAEKIATLQVKNTCNYEEYNSNFIDDRWEKFHEDFRVWSEELVDNKFNERNMPIKSDYFGVQIVDMMKYTAGDESATKTVEKDLKTQYELNADKSTTLLDKVSWTKMKVSQAKTEILAQKLRRFKIVMTKNSQEYLVWHCTSMLEKMVTINRNGESKLKSRSDWNGLRCYFGPTNGVRNTPFWNVKKEGYNHYSGDVLSYCKMRGVHSPLFTNDDKFKKNGAHLYTWMNIMLNGHNGLKARLAGLYIMAAMQKSKGKDITNLESKPLSKVKDVNRLKKAPRKKSNKNNKKNRTDVKQAEKLAELKDAVHSADEYDVEKYKTTKVDSNTIEDAIGGLGNIDIVDNGPLWPDTTTVKELRERCKELALTGYSSMNKTELLALVRSNDEPKTTKRNRKRGSKRSKTPKFD